jgi:hypothetical protein
MRLDLKEYLVIRILDKGAYLRCEQDGPHAIVSSHHTLEAAMEEVERLKREHLGDRYQWVNRDAFFIPDR